MWPKALKLQEPTHSFFGSFGWCSLPLHYFFFSSKTPLWAEAEVLFKPKFEFSNSLPASTQQHNLPVKASLLTVLICWKISSFRAAQLSRLLDTTSLILSSSLLMKGNRETALLRVEQWCSRVLLQSRKITAAMRKYLTCKPDNCFSVTSYFIVYWVTIQYEICWMKFTINSMFF